MLGGGRQHFLPTSATDPEYATAKGKRVDGKDLAAVWKSANPTGAFVWNSDSFNAVDTKDTKKLLGLFEPSHMQFEADRKASGGKEPSLADMTRKAIAMLSKNRKGYVLMVEAGRIDHAHHAGNARRALQDTVALNEALKAAMDSVNLKDTLIVVTSDHSHTFTMSGYPERGNPILGVVSSPIGKPTLAKDGKAYTTLGYANGPGAVNANERADPSKQDTEALDYRQQSLVGLNSETHGGDDVVCEGDRTQSAFVQRHDRAEHDIPHNESRAGLLAIWARAKAERRVSSQQRPPWHPIQLATLPPARHALFQTR